MSESDTELNNIINILSCTSRTRKIGIFIVEGELISLNNGYPNIVLTQYSNRMGRVIDKLHKDKATYGVLIASKRKELYERQRVSKSVTGIV